jgi:hypothetical protein
MQQDVKAAARRVIARMSHMATHENETPDTTINYQSLLAQLALAQLALTYPGATLGVCLTDGAPLRFVAGDDGLYVRCDSDPLHGFKIA